MTVAPKCANCFKIRTACREQEGASYVARRESRQWNYPYPVQFPGFRLRLGGFDITFAAVPETCPMRELAAGSAKSATKHDEYAAAAV